MMKSCLITIAGFGLMFGLMALAVWLTSGADGGDAEPSYAEIECSQCEDDLEEAQSRVSELEECVQSFNDRLDGIHDIAQDSVWSDYNSMGDALDEIEYDAASFNWSLGCS